MAGRIVSVNVGLARPNPYRRSGSTGFAKEPVAGQVEVRAPGPAKGVSGVAGDYIGARRHHGGDAQAVYAFAREVLDDWERRLGRTLPGGAFGENLTTAGVDVDGALLGERWRVGSRVELVVTVPRVPCQTFRGFVGERGWLRRFTEDGRSGTYLSVAVPGPVEAGDHVEVVHRPDHGVTVRHVFRALLLDRSLLPGLAAAGEDLAPELAETVATAQALAIQ